MLDSSIVPFDFDGHPVRVSVADDGKPLFVLADVCKVLDLGNPSMVANRLDPDDLSTIEVIDSIGRTQRAHAVTESGVIDVTLDSRKPEARRFRRWLTHEVVPQILQTGSYGTAPALTGPELMAKALIEAQTVLEAKDTRIAELEPKAHYVDVFVADGDLMKIRTIASNLNVAEGWLRELLLRSKWIYVETATRWSERKQEKETVRRYSAYSDKRPYFEPVQNHEAPRFKGEAMHTLKVTPAGAEAIARLVRRSQLTALAS